MPCRARSAADCRHARARALLAPRCLAARRGHRHREPIRPLPRHAAHDQAGYATHNSARAAAAGCRHGVRRTRGERREANASGMSALCCAVLCCAVLCCAVLCYAVRPRGVNASGRPLITPTRVLAVLRPAALRVQRKWASCAAAARSPCRTSTPSRKVRPFGVRGHQRAARPCFGFGFGLSCSTPPCAPPSVAAVAAPATAARKVWRARKGQRAGFALISHHGHACCCASCWPLIRRPCHRRNPARRPGQRLCRRAGDGQIQPQRNLRLLWPVPRHAPVPNRRQGLLQRRVQLRVRN